MDCTSYTRLPSRPRSYTAAVALARDQPRLKTMLRSHVILRCSCMLRPIVFLAGNKSLQPTRTRYKYRYFFHEECALCLALFALPGGAFGAEYFFRSGVVVHQRSHAYIQKGGIRFPPSPPAGVAVSPLSDVQRRYTRYQACVISHALLGCIMAATVLGPFLIAGVPYPTSRAENPLW